MHDAFLLFFKGLARHAPSTDEATLRALAACQPRPEAPRIADLGCGTGASALVLLEALPHASLLAVDQLAASLQTLQERAERRDIAARLTTFAGDALALPQGPFDILWAEGSIYAMGWAQALQAWQDKLEAGGFLVVSDAVWTESEIPKVARDYWDAAYPDMTTAEARVKQAQSLGWTVVDHFEMPREGWDLYYAPLEQRVVLVESRGKPSKEMQAVANEVAKEIAMYRTLGHTWNYHFFVLQR